MAADMSCCLCSVRKQVDPGWIGDSEFSRRIRSGSSFAGSGFHNFVLPRRTFENSGWTVGFGFGLHAGNFSSRLASGVGNPSFLGKIERDRGPAERPRRNQCGGGGIARGSPLRSGLDQGNSRPCGCCFSTGSVGGVVGFAIATLARGDCGGAWPAVF